MILVRTILCPGNVDFDSDAAADCCDIITRADQSNCTQSMLKAHNAQKNGRLF